MQWLYTLNFSHLFHPSCHPSQNPSHYYLFNSNNYQFDTPFIRHFLYLSFIVLKYAKGTDILDFNFYLHYCLGNDASHHYNKSSNRNHSKKYQFYLSLSCSGLSPIAFYQSRWVWWNGRYLEYYNWTASK